MAVDSPNFVFFLERHFQHLFSFFLSFLVQPASLNRTAFPMTNFSDQLSIKSLDYPYPGAYERIEKVNFRNLKLYIFNENKEFQTQGKLKNGSYEYKDPIGGGESLTLDSVYYLPSEHPNTQFALVLYTWFCILGFL